MANTTPAIGAESRGDAPATPQPMKTSVVRTVRKSAKRASHRCAEMDQRSILSDGAPPQAETRAASVDPNPTERVPSIWWRHGCLQARATVQCPAMS